VERTVTPSGAPIDLGVRHEAGVAVELAAVGEGDEVAPALGVEQQCSLAAAERRVDHRDSTCAACAARSARRRAARAAFGRTSSTGTGVGRGGLDQPAERADLAGGRGTAALTRAQRTGIGSRVAGQQRRHPIEEAQVERGLRPW
jgi:hypothetical protein